MTKKRERSPEEHYKGIIKMQKKQIEQLKREVSRLSKKEAIYDEHLDCNEETEQPIEMVEEQRCPKDNGKLSTVIIGNRSLTSCDSCRYRRSAKIG